MGRAKDITGNKYGKLLAIEDTGIKTSNGSTKWKFLCDCGNEYVARKSHVTSGTMTCCVSCQRLEAKIKATTHGLTYNESGEKCKTFQAYLNIKKRCYNTTNNAYKDYGAKGIKLQTSWENNPKLFVEYMGEAPSREHSVERLDITRGYEEGNLIWALPTTQSRNRSAIRDLPTCVYKRKNYYTFNKKLNGVSHTRSFMFDDDMTEELAELACLEYRDIIFERLNAYVLPEGEKYNKDHGKVR